MNSLDINIERKKKIFLRFLFLLFIYLIYMCVTIM